MIIHKNIILFDGVCNLCNHAVDFIIKHDSKVKFRFAPLQSETGMKFIQMVGLPVNDLQTLIYIKGERYYFRSTAVLHILNDLGGFRKLFFVFIIVPPFIRDFFYNIISGTRYRVFGKRPDCMVPSPEIRERFSLYRPGQ
jgi:predicted DCC family thiol-disulfide oxidoreductase YuxK